jgi:hypothetical protein
MEVDCDDRDLSVVDQTQTATSEPAAGSDRDPVRKAAVCLDDGQQAPVLRGQFESQELAGVYAHSYTEYLARAQARMELGQHLKVGFEVS